MGNKHRPFYRVVASKSTAARDGAFIEAFGYYNPLTTPKRVEIDSERAMHWLMIGAQPTETVAYLFKKEGILDRFFSERPNAKDKFKFLDKTTAAMSQQSVVGHAPATEPTTEPKPADAPTEPVASEEATAEPVAEAAPDEAATEPAAEAAPEVSTTEAPPSVEPESSEEEPKQ